MHAELGLLVTVVGLRLVNDARWDGNTRVVEVMEDIINGMIHSHGHASRGFLGSISHNGISPADNSSIELLHAHIHLTALHIQDGGVERGYISVNYNERSGEDVVGTGGNTRRLRLGMPVHTTVYFQILS